MSAWWAQKLLIEYEQARGVRAPGARPDGTFSVGVTRTLAVPVDRAFAAFADPVVRARWLPGATLHERTSRPGRSARFDWGDGTTRVAVSFLALDAERCQVAVEHERLPDAAAVDRTRTDWQARLGALRDLLEG